jgi:BirA family biotin operon repressor/biotin-[acetyl-CoA-carboxylase] ligase
MTGKPSTPSGSQRVLAVLADGQFHSGEKLAARLKVSRSAIWKLVRALRALGIEVQSVPRRGYRLPRPVDLYDAAAMSSHLSKRTRARLDRADVLMQVDSTNRHLSAQPAPDIGRAGVCVAEVQTIGKGRRGRTWVAPFGSGICLSVSWRFADAPASLSALGLAVAVAMLRALDELGATDVNVKWPNDLVWKHRKLGGILLEVAGEAGGPVRVIVGIGINVHMTVATRLALAEQQAALVADLGEILQSRLPDRNRITAALVEHLVAVLDEFATGGFQAFLAEWSRRDALADAEVKVLTGTETILGIARGVTAEGALRVEVGGETRQYFSADVSLRAAKGPR